MIAVSAQAATAAAPAWPTQDAIDHALKQRPLPDAVRIEQVPIPALPRIPAPALPAMDIEAIARRHIELKDLATSPRENGATLRIFVTLAMPAASLQLLVAQAERAQATLVLRGLKANSMKQTLDAVQRLIGKRRVSWQIDPEAYTRYGVRQAPTFVLMKDGNAIPADAGTCGTSCMATGSFYSVAGDVSLDYALDTLVRRYPDAGRDAGPYLTRLRSTP